MCRFSVFLVHFSAVFVHQITFCPLFVLSCPFLVHFLSFLRTNLTCSHFHNLKQIKLSAENCRKRGLYTSEYGNIQWGSYTREQGFYTSEYGTMLYLNYPVRFVYLFTSNSVFFLVVFRHFFCSFQNVLSFFLSLSVLFSPFCPFACPFFV